MHGKEGVSVGPIQLPNSKHVNMSRKKLHTATLYRFEFFVVFLCSFFHFIPFIFHLIFFETEESLRISRSCLLVFGTMIAVIMFPRWATSEASTDEQSDVISGGSYFICEMIACFALIRKIAAMMNAAMILLMRIKLIL